MNYWMLKASMPGYGHGYVQWSKEWGSAFQTVAPPAVEVGDPVLLWRDGRGGGLVAFGAIVGTADMASAQSDIWRVQGSVDGGRADFPPVTAIVKLDHLMLATPFSAEALESAGLNGMVARAGAMKAGRGMVPLELSASQERELFGLAERARPSALWPAAWDIPVGAVVQRAELQEVYGGDSSCLASSSEKTPNSFLFLDPDQTGEMVPRWDGPLLTTPGRGQSQRQWWGDLSWENLAVFSHRRSGFPLRVFMVRDSECLYVGEFAVASVDPIAGWVVTSGRENPDCRKARKTRHPIFRCVRLCGLSSLPEGEEFEHAPRVSIRLGPVSGKSTDAQFADGSNYSAGALIRGLMKVLDEEPDIAESIGELDEAQLVVGVVQRARRQMDLNDLRVAVENRNTKEADLQKIIQRMTWVFGGEFVRTGRRNLTAKDQLDLTLLRPDGTLHGVELKKANDPILTGYRSHYIPSTQVHQAACQADNYLRELDEKRPQILADWEIDCRRASMTVVIGHKNFLPPGVTAKEAHEVIRTYNADRARVAVTTYDQLVDNAQRILDMMASPR